MRLAKLTEKQRETEINRDKQREIERNREKYKETERKFPYSSNERCDDLSLMGAVCVDAGVLSQPLIDPDGQIRA